VAASTITEEQRLLQKEEWKCLKLEMDVWQKQCDHEHLLEEQKGLRAVGPSRLGMFAA